MRKLLVLIILITLFSFGCAWTDVTSIKNPQLSNIQFSKIMVTYAVKDMALRKYSEYAFINNLNKNGINAVASIDLLPPIKDYSDEELGSILRKNQIDGVMEVLFTDAYSSKHYVPKTSYTYGSASLYGNNLYGSSTTLYSGGQSYSKPRTKYEINVWAINLGKIFWKATTLTKGNAYAGSKTMIDSLAQEVVEKFISDNY